MVFLQQPLVNGVEGSFNFIHSASTTGIDRADEFFCIVGGSGTDGLKGISGSGGITIDIDGTHPAIQIPGRAGRGLQLRRSPQHIRERQTEIYGW
jgi:hypothetical protein